MSTNDYSVERLDVFLMLICQSQLVTKVDGFSRFRYCCDLYDCLPVHEAGVAF